MSFWLIKIHVVNNLPNRVPGIISKARVNVVKYFYFKKKSNATISYEKKGNSLMIAS